MRSDDGRSATWSTLRSCQRVEFHAINGSSEGSDAAEPGSSASADNPASAWKAAASLRLPLN